MMTENYFSGWIENLGVVPLFLLAAFLFLPVFEAFLLRMAFVCFVFDAMGPSHLFRKLRFHKLLYFVKVSLWGLAIPCIAQPPSSNLYLAKGEQISLAAPGLKQFSVGNPDILGRKYSPKSKRIYLKGKKLGYSDVIVWSKSGKHIYHAYVLSKSQNLKLAQAANSLKGIGLKTRFEGKKVWAEGRIKNHIDLKRTLQLQKDFKNQVNLQVSLTKKLQKELIAEIYLKLNQRPNLTYFCKLEEHFPLCNYQAVKQDKKLEKNILQNFGIQLTYHPHRLSSNNLKVQFKFIEIETQEREDFSFGLNRLSTSVANYLNSPRSLYENNLIQFNGSEYRMKILAEPEVQSILDQKNKIQIGLNIPYKVVNRDGFASTEWVETGLKVGFKLHHHQGKILLKYESELSAPSVDQIKTNEQSGSFFPKLGGDYAQIFQIGLEASKKEHSGPLGIQDIPLLGNLLKSHSHLKTYKVFLGFVRINYE